MTQTPKFEKKTIWVHEGYKDAGTASWTVREQDEKPNAPTGYLRTDWKRFTSGEYVEALETALKAARDLIADDDTQIDNTILFDVYFDAMEKVDLNG